MRSGGLLALVALASSCWVGLAPRQASACSVLLPGPAPTDPAKVGLDQSPPQIFDVIVTSIRASEPGSCLETLNIGLYVDAEDDQTPREKLGYRLQDVEHDYWIYDEPVAWLDPWIYQDAPVRLHYRVIVVDEAGNESAPFEVSYGDPEDEDAGCSLVPRAPGAAHGAGWLLGLLSAGLLRRRR